MILAKLIVSGRVQGVFYRATVRDIARNLGIRGYVKNLLDGNVEIVCECDIERQYQEFVNRIDIKEDYGIYVRSISVKEKHEIKERMYNEFMIKY